MDKKEQLGAVIDAVIKGDTDAAKAAFSQYIQAKTREVLGITPVEAPMEPAAEPVKEGVLVRLQEMVDALVDSPVKLHGDKVIVDGKQVGLVHTDLTDFDSGINFIEDGGKFSKEFDTVEDLFTFLIQKYTKRGANK